MYVSHETIYHSLFIQTRGVLKKELIAHQRGRRTMRRPKNSTTAAQERGQIRDAVSIRERPAEVADRAVPGLWEGDLIAGAKNSHIATLVERHSRYVMLVRVPGKDTASVVHALTEHVHALPNQMVKALTGHRDTDLAKHQRFTVAPDLKVHFCDPRSPWQRGSHENTNGLLRQYFSKSTDLSGYTQQDLNAVAFRLNTRPRKSLECTTPVDKLAATVATTS